MKKLYLLVVLLTSIIFSASAQKASIEYGTMFKDYRNAYHSFIGEDEAKVYTMVNSEYLMTNDIKTLNKLSLKKIRFKEEKNGKRLYHIESVLRDGQIIVLAGRYNKKSKTYEIWREVLDTAGNVESTWERLMKLRGKEYQYGSQYIKYSEDNKYTVFLKSVQKSTSRAYQYYCAVLDDKLNLVWTAEGDLPAGRECKLAEYTISNSGKVMLIWTSMPISKEDTDQFNKDGENPSMSIFKTLTESETKTATLEIEGSRILSQSINLSDEHSARVAGLYIQNENSKTHLDGLYSCELNLDKMEFTKPVKKEFEKELIDSICFNLNSMIQSKTHLGTLVSLGTILTKNDDLVFGVENYQYYTISSTDKNGFTSYSNRLSHEKALFFSIKKDGSINWHQIIYKVSGGPYTPEFKETSSTIFGNKFVLVSSVIASEFHKQNPKNITKKLPGLGKYNLVNIACIITEDGQVKLYELHARSKAKKKATLKSYSFMRRDNSMLFICSANGRKEMFAEIKIK